MVKLTKVGGPEKSLIIPKFGIKLDDDVATVNSAKRKLASDGR